MGKRAQYALAVPASAFADDGLSGTDIRVLAWICAACRTGGLLRGWCWPSVGRMADGAGVPLRSTHRSLVRLEERGHIVRCRWLIHEGRRVDRIPDGAGEGQPIKHDRRVRMTGVCAYVTGRKISVTSGSYDWAISATGGTKLVSPVAVNQCHQRQTNDPLRGDNDHTPPIGGDVGSNELGEKIKTGLAPQRPAPGGGAGGRPDGEPMSDEQLAGLLERLGRL